MFGRLTRVMACFALAVAASAVCAEQLKITSVTFSAPAPLKAGDIITVDLAGTAGVRAAFSVKGLLPATQLREVSVGSYHGSVKVPEGKFVRNAPLVGYLGTDKIHAAPVQASRLVSVLQTKVDEPTKLPPVLPEPQPKPVDPPKPPAPKPVAVADPPQPKPTPPPASAPAPVAVRGDDNIVISTPANGATLKHMIMIKGTAKPSSTVRVIITYSNGMSGMLKLAGDVASQNLAAGKNGEFRMGPIALDGPLATDGLRFTIKAYYPDRTDHGTADITVTGKRD